MKDFFEKIKAKFTKNKAVDDRKKMTAQPYRDWAVVFGIISFGFISISAFSAYLFIVVKNGGLFGNETDVTTPPRKFNEEELIKTLNLFSEKEALYQTRLQEEVKISDPAL